MCIRGKIFQGYGRNESGSYGYRLVHDVEHTSWRLREADAAGDQTGSMSGEHELPTASVVRSSQATPARRRGQLCTDADPQGSTYRSQFGAQTTGATSIAATCSLRGCKRSSILFQLGCPQWHAEYRASQPSPGCGLTPRVGTRPLHSSRSPRVNALR